MSYELSDMIAKFRREMEDTVEPYLWTDDEITDYLDQAQDEFCENVDVLTGQVTLTYVASDEFVDTPNYMTRARSATAADGRPVALYNAEEWEEAGGLTDDYGINTPSTQWRTDTGEKLRVLITDLESGKHRLYPIPTADSSVILHIYRRPVELLEEAGEFEVVDKSHQRCILLRARSLAYEKHDAETYNEQLAATYRDKFDERVEDLHYDVKRKQRRAKSVSYPEM